MEEKEYIINDRIINVKVDYDNHNVWLSQDGMALLFNVKVPTISRHLLNLNSGLNESTISIMEKVQIEGTRQVKRKIKIYNLDIIKSIGHNINSVILFDFMEWVDNILKYNEYSLIEEKSFNGAIKSMIYTIRGEKVMLDFDLASLYGYDTKDFNNQIKNNLERFDEEFRFQLTKNEWNEILWWKISTANNLSKIRTIPYAFTEQGIYMLMTVLKGDLAVSQSKLLIRTFKQMKDYIVENNQLSSTNEILKLSSQVNKNTNKIEKLVKDNKTIKEKLEIVMDNFIDPSTYKHYLTKDGERIESDIAYQTIYKLAKESIIIIDDYIDIKTLQLLKVANNVEIIIITDNKAKNGLNKTYINDFINDTNINLKIINNNKIFHSRYIAIDYNTDNYKLYFCGGSSKDGGNKINTIVEIEDVEVYKPLIERFI